MVVTTANTPAIRKALLGSEARTTRPEVTRPDARRPGDGHAEPAHPGTHARAVLRRALRG